MLRLRRWSGLGDEVDELLDPAEQGGLEVVVRRAPGRGCAARPGRCRPGRVRPAELAGRRPSSTRSLRGTSGHALEAEPLGLHRGPDVDERVADDQHVRPTGERRDVVGDPALLGARRRGGRRARRPGAPGRGRSRAGGRPGRRRRRGTRRRRPRSAGRRPRPSRRARRRGGPRRRSGWRGRPGPCAPWTATEPDAVRVGLRRARCATGAREDHRTALEQEAGAEREGAPLAAAVLQRQRCRGRGRPRRSRRTSRSSTSSTTAPSSAAASTARPRFGRAPVGGEDVGAVAVGGVTAQR